MVINNPKNCWGPGFAHVAGEDFDKDIIDVNLIVNRTFKSWDDKIDVFNTFRT